MRDCAQARNDDKKRPVMTITVVVVKVKVMVIITNRKKTKLGTP